MRELDMDPAFADRYLNEGFSGGERKRNEVLQMAVLEPDLAILDETDSGLDIDALKVVAEGVSRLRNDERGFVIITHYQRMLDYITPDVVHVFLDGRIVATGGPDLADQIEEAGYDHYRSGAATS
jgi:Fe-S cluster assembly ATP-binding protein